MAVEVVDWVATNQAIRYNSLAKRSIVTRSKRIVPDLLRYLALGVERCKPERFLLILSLYINISLINNTLPLIQLLESLIRVSWFLKHSQYLSRLHCSSCAHWWAARRCRVRWLRRCSYQRIVWRSHFASFIIFPDVHCSCCVLVPLVWPVLSRTIHCNSLCA